MTGEAYITPRDLLVVLGGSVLIILWIVLTGRSEKWGRVFWGMLALIVLLAVLFFILGAYLYWITPI